MAFVTIDNQDSSQSVPPSQRLTVAENGTVRESLRSPLIHTHRSIKSLQKAEVSAY